MKKLVLFGDSLFGQVGKNRLIAMETSLTGYDIYNCAVNGWDTNDCVNKAPYIARLQPDVVVISLGTNDAAPWKQVPLETFQNNLPKIFDSFAGSTIIYFLPPPVDSTKHREPGEELNNDDVRPYFEAAKEISQANHILYIDSFEVFMPMLESGTEYHTEDGVHLTDFAYSVISKELAQLLD